jgi:hypothetical protein
MCVCVCVCVWVSACVCVSYRYTFRYQMNDAFKLELLHLVKLDMLLTLSAHVHWHESCSLDRPTIAYA